MIKIFLHKIKENSQMILHKMKCKIKINKKISKLLNINVKIVD